MNWSNSKEAGIFSSSLAHTTKRRIPPASHPEVVLIGQETSEGRIFPPTVSFCVSHSDMMKFNRSICDCRSSVSSSNLSSSPDVKIAARMGKQTLSRHWVPSRIVETFSLSPDVLDNLSVTGARSHKSSINPSTTSNCNGIPK